MRAHRATYFAAHRSVRMTAIKPALKTAIKICGLTRAADAAHAVAHGAAYIGAILAGGPRLLTIAEAAVVLGPPRHGVRRVAVFGEQSRAEIVAVVQALSLDVAQLHGDPTPDDVRHIGRETGRAVWPVLRVAGTTLPPDAEALGRAAGALVLDAKVVGQLGGTGVALDWSGLSDEVVALRRAVPALQLVLAGGLRASNVAEAMRLLAPDVVDVSSGVELAPGVKDPDAVEQFVRAVHTATGIRA